MHRNPQAVLPSQAPALSPGSCLSIAPCNVVSSGPGATPSSSASRVRRDSYDARASLWRPVAYRALMRNACRRSRSGWSATRPASSAARSAWSPVSRRARAWSSRAVRRCSARRSAAGRTKGASAKSAYAGPPPQLQGLRQQLRPDARVSDRTGPGHQGPEAYGVRLVVGVAEPQPVARRLAHHAVAADGPAQLRDLGLESARRVGRRRVGPQVVDEPVGGDRSSVVREQISQQGPDLGLRDLHLSSLAVPHHQWPEHPQPHRRHRTGRETAPRPPSTATPGAGRPRRPPEGRPKVLRSGRAQSRTDRGSGRSGRP